MEANDIGILPEGHRNDGLTRLAGSLRRKGKASAEIEAELLRANDRRCRPPLPELEVSKIARSVASYPPGGPDPLEHAWEGIQGSSNSKYDLFLALAKELQRARPDQAIALPLERIADPMHCDWTLVRRYRREAIASAELAPVDEYIAHRRAATFRVPLGSQSPTKPSSGLVGHSPSGTALVGQP